MNQSKTVFISGISTEVGKTIASAIVTEALQADYWKPIQAGELDFCDTQKVKNLTSNTTSQFHKNAFALKTPMSPHAAAKIDKVSIDLESIQRPVLQNQRLVIEGAGGLLVPFNDSECIIDLIQPEDYVILVSRHYLGSINHTLLSVEALKIRGLQKIGILFSGNEHPTTEEIILSKTGLTCLGRINEESSFNPVKVSDYASKFKQSLERFLDS